MVDIVTMMKYMAVNSVNTSSWHDSEAWLWGSNDKRQLWTAKGSGTGVADRDPRSRTVEDHVLSLH